MRPISLGRRSQLRAHIKPLEPLGYSAHKILKRGGIADWLYGAPDDWVPVRYIAATIELAARATGDERYGFWLAEQNSVSSLAKIGKAIGRSVTVYDALRTSALSIRYLIADVTIWLDQDGDTVWFCKSEPRGAQAGRRQLERYSLLKMVHVVQQGLGANWKPAKIQVCALDSMLFESWETFANADIKCACPYSAIAIAKSTLGLPIPNGNSMSVHQALKQLRADPPAQDFAESLRQVVSVSLVEGALSIEDAADIAGISSRTLKRWLADEGLTYRMLVDQVRYAAAERMLRDPDLPIREIAHDLGYANAPHFWRAFRRWAGVTPGEYRIFAQNEANDVN